MKLIITRLLNQYLILKCLSLKRKIWLNVNRLHRALEEVFLLLKLGYYLISYDKHFYRHKCFITLIQIAIFKLKPMY